MRRMAIAGAATVLAVAFLVLLGSGVLREPKTAPSPVIGRRAPAFALALFDGGRLRLEDLRGKVVFLNFWASWCPPCRAEARTLEAAWQAYRGRDVVFVGVNVQDQGPRAREFLREFGITYPNGMDGDGEIQGAYGVWGLPETFFVSREGRITYRHQGTLRLDTITGKLDEALRGIASAGEGRGEYRSIR